MDDTRTARIARPPVGLPNNCHKARKIFFASSLLVALQSEASLPQSAPVPLTAPNRRGMRRAPRRQGVRTTVCYFRNMRITRQSSNAQPRQPSEKEAPQQQRLLQTRHAALSADKQHWHCQQSPAAHREITTPIYVHAPRVLVGSFRRRIQNCHKSYAVGFSVPCTIAARHALFQLSGSWRCARLGRMDTRRHIRTYAHASQCDTALTRVGRVEKRRCPQLPPIMPQSSSPTEKPSSCTQRHETCSKRQRNSTGSTRPTHCRCTRNAAVRPAPATGP